MPDHRCHHAGRPEYSQNCRTEPCPTAAPIPEKTYKWKTATWTTVGGSNAASTSNQVDPTSSTPFNAESEDKTPTSNTLTHNSPTTVASQSDTVQTTEQALTSPPATDATTAGAAMTTVRELRTSPGKSISAARSATLESVRPITFDWNSHLSPFAGATTPRAAAIRTASYFPMQFPHRPTYAYFANYYRFDSAAVKQQARQPG